MAPESRCCFSFTVISSQKADVYNTDEVARIVAGHAVVISAFNPGSTTNRSRAREPLLMGSRRLE
jgi:putative NADH-flavin reductase